MKYVGSHRAVFLVFGFLLCCSPVASKEECRLEFLEDSLTLNVSRVATATGGTLYVSSSPRVAASCRGRVTEVQVLYKASGRTNKEGLLAETAIAVYTPVNTGLGRSSEFVWLKPETGILRNTSDSMIVQATFFLSRDTVLETEPGQTIGVLISSNSLPQNAQSRMGYPLLIGESADTQAIGGHSDQVLGQPTFISNEQGEPSVLPAYSFYIENDTTTMEDGTLSQLPQNVSVDLATTIPDASNSSSMPDNSSSPDSGAPRSTPLASILSPIAVVILVAILTTVAIATCLCCAIWKKRRSSHYLQGSPKPKKTAIGERAGAHTDVLDALERATHLESHGDQEESSGYEVVVQHKEIRGTSSVFFEINSCYMYVDADEMDYNPDPYEVPMTIYENTVQQEASSRRHIGATGNDAHPRTALDTGGGKEGMYMNVPFAPPPTSVQGLRKTLAKRKCVELPRGALKTASIVGAGKFGDVYSGVWKSSYGEQEVAIKVLKKNATEEHKVKFLQEAVIMSQFRHPHIARLLGAVTFKEPKMLVLEYLHKGDLLNWLVAQNSKSEIDNQELPRYLFQFCHEIADGMNYLSNKGFIHRDLAARNILLDNTLTCKIADFGLSRNLSGSQFYSATGANIPVRWSPPEVLLEKKFTMSSDVWSYGMVMYEIWSLGKSPYPDLLDLRDVVKVVIRGREHIQDPPIGCPRSIYEVMIKCWSYVYHKRPTFAEVLTLLSVISASDLLDV